QEAELFDYSVPLGFVIVEEYLEIIFHQALRSRNERRIERPIVWTEQHHFVARKPGDDPVRHRRSWVAWRRTVAVAA
ncbi:MAG: hypothetical protein VX309_06325, partial [Pseudomonadota bacterium]|nr:hypothetical protein [Pseudomonadota bacterium]